jgi:hypothetical protein
MYSTVRQFFDATGKKAKTVYTRLAGERGGTPSSMRLTILFSNMFKVKQPVDIAIEEKKGPVVSDEHSRQELLT